jgi:hypothetical protein
MALPAAPFIAPTGGSIDQRLALVAQALNRKADQTSSPVYSSVILLAPGGGAWQLTVDDTGALSTASVPR